MRIPRKRITDWEKALDKATVQTDNSYYLRLACALLGEIRDILLEKDK